MERTAARGGYWHSTLPGERLRRSEPAGGHPAASTGHEPRVPVESAVPAAADVYRVSPEVAATLPLRVGDRVCWISDNGPEPGAVGWIGKLPAEDGGRDWMVGVEFDNPVGSGNGCYRGHRLFAAKLNHASIVPINGLMRAEDFEQPAAAGGSPACDQQSHRGQAAAAGGAAESSGPGDDQ